MGKSPGKWIKTVLFGKKSSKSNLSKGATLDKKASINRKTQSKDSDADSMVISSPVPHVMHANGEHTELEKTTSTNLTSDTVEVVRSNLALNTANEDEVIRLEQAATMAQAACRGYLARRAIWAIKGITRIQAHIRGHLALTRGIIVRLSVDNRHVLQNFTAGELLDEKNTGLLKKSLRSEKLSTNAFGTKLVASSHSTMPLSIQYDPTEPNSARNWLDRWSTSYFWEPLPKPKRVPDTKPKRKQMKSQHEETEAARPKRGARRVSAPNLEGRLVNSSENEKSKPTLRKVSSQQKESVQEQSHIELEKVKQSLRKISVSVSSVGPSEKPEIITENPETSLGTDQSFEKVNDLNDEMTILPLPEPLPVPPLEEDKVKPPHNVLQDNHHPVEIDPPEINGKESQKARRRKSFPVKEEHHPESVLQNTPTLPSYMAATESAKAKLRALALEDGAESGFVRRHSLPSSTGKLSLQSPRVQKPLQANVKGWSRSNKSQISARDDKMLQTGWKR
ncbi:putative IQ motif, EF-hand binding protein [Helianthus debilis subsp. tardiflorus]